MRLTLEQGSHGDRHKLPGSIAETIPVTENHFAESVATSFEIFKPLPCVVGLSLATAVQPFETTLEALGVATISMVSIIDLTASISRTTMSRPVDKPGTSQAM